MLIAVINIIIKAVGVFLVGLTKLLPSSPFQKLDYSGVQEYLGNLAWIIPIKAIITMLSAWLLAILGFYAYQFVMRWVKAIK